MEKNIGRTHRVGTVTCGLMFIVYGTLFLLHTIMPKFSYGILFDLWPLILISLGVEILVSCTRKNQEERKIVYDFPAVLLVMFLVLFVVIMAAADYGMRVAHEWNIEHLSNYSSYFSQYSTQKHDGQSRMQGTVYLAENDAILETINVEKETTITVMGYIGSVEGDARLIYTAEGGTEILITDCDNSSFDKTITVPAGEGNVSFAAYSQKAVCDFDIQILWGDDVSVNPESMESVRGIEAELPEIEETPEAERLPEIGEMSAMEDISNPVTDNWPESIRFDSEGMSAELYEFPLTIEEPMELSLSYITDSGTLNMWIEDAGGSKMFNEKDIQTDDYTVSINKAGTYTVFLKAKYYYGSFVITPHN
ncbi:MAG: hypothetical protein HDR30_02685 [Lachnospiraceae bacterium]|nr:hypothetical protein [Lachnospiraceae bacterium]